MFVDGSVGGEAFVFSFSGASWTQTSVLMGTASNYSVDGRFGSSLSAGPGVVAIGAPSDGSDGAGLVYVFSNVSNQWVMSNTIAPSDGSSNFGETFGFSVSLSNNVLAVGAPNASKCQCALRSHQYQQYQ